jgi:RimJ/RimL family protein N-acetyltransferase
MLARVRLAYPQPALSTPRLRLRRWQPSDALDLVRCCNDPEIQRWLPPIPVPYTEDDAKAFISRLSSENSDRVGFAVQTADVGVAGSISARPLGAGIVQIGYWVAPEVRRMGIATESLALLTGWLAVQEGTGRVQLFTDAENVPSMSVAERAGFRREAVLRNWYDLHGERRDAAMYSFLPGDAR